MNKFGNFISSMEYYDIIKTELYNECHVSGETINERYLEINFRFNIKYCEGGYDSMKQFILNNCDISLNDINIYRNTVNLTVKDINEAKKHAIVFRLNFT